MTLSNILKNAACASVLGIAAIAGSASFASAATYETRCYGDDCYRVRCDDFGFGCPAPAVGDVVPYCPIKQEDLLLHDTK